MLNRTTRARNPWERRLRHCDSCNGEYITYYASNDLHFNSFYAKQQQAGNMFQDGRLFALKQVRLNSEAFNEVYYMKNNYIVECIYIYIYIPPSGRCDAKIRGTSIPDSILQSLHGTIFFPFWPISLLQITSM